ncbi:MAG: hypothetical protein OXQ28_08950, partial [Acidobacteriota bacterium]|nr:hypothetical protein [Acidobacteriota bacterium]
MNRFRGRRLDDLQGDAVGIDHHGPGPVWYRIRAHVHRRPLRPLQPHPGPPAGSDVLVDDDRRPDRRMSKIRLAAAASSAQQTISSNSSGM